MNWFLIGIFILLLIQTVWAIRRDIAMFSTRVQVSAIKEEYGALLEHKNKEVDELTSTCMSLTRALTTKAEEVLALQKRIMESAS